MYAALSLALALFVTAPNAGTGLARVHPSTRTALAASDASVIALLDAEESSTVEPLAADDSMTVHPIVADDSSAVDPIAAFDPSPRAGRSDDTLALARSRWAEGAKLMHVPGMAVVGVADGKVRFVECLGVRRAAEKAPIDGDTRFYIASVTKTYVATAAKAFEEQKKLSLASTVQRYLPRFTLADAQAAALISVEDLLCHRPGLDSEAIVFRDAYTGQIDDATYFRLLGGVTPLGRTRYSNVHFTLAGRVLSAVDGGAKWQDVLQKRLFDPLKMSRTTGYASILWGDADSAEPHIGTLDGNAAVPHKTDRTMHAAGGLGTTPNDVARWLRFQMGDGSLDGVRVLSREGLADLRRRRSDQEPNSVTPWFKLDGFGLGWNVGTYRGELVCAHGGGYTGVTAMVAFLPERNVGAAVMMNRDSSSVSSMAITDALDVLLGRELDPVSIARIRDSAPKVNWPVVPPPPENPARKAGALSLDAAAYVGHYTNDEWGELDVKLENGELRLELGDWKCALAADATDAFQARQSVANTFAGRFIVDANGVSGVELHPMGDATVLFQRVAKK